MNKEGVFAAGFMPAVSLNMRILITNDDGIGASGIVALEKALVSYGYDVCVCAPDGQRSSFGHSLTTSKSVSITEIGPQRYQCSGTPADCVQFSLRSRMMSFFPDLIISGINNGYNLSSDILSSGTVGAAREAALSNISAIAVSLQDNSPNGFDHAAKYVSTNLMKLLSFCRKGVFLNVNIPMRFKDGFEIGRLSRLIYPEKFITSKENNKVELFEVHQEILPYPENNDSDIDFNIVKEGFVAITPVEVLPDLDIVR